MHASIPPRRFLSLFRYPQHASAWLPNDRIHPRYGGVAIAWALACMCWIWSGTAVAQDAATAKSKTPPATNAPATVPLKFRVRVPEGTPPESRLFLAGNTDAMGPWQPDAFPLKQTGPTEYSGEIGLPKGFTLQYKVTRGSWSTVEKTALGGEISNRIYQVDQPATVDVEVAAWATTRAVPKNTGRGELRWRSFESQHVSGSRRVTVWLPSVPAEHPTKQEIRWPVVYFLDGQNVFDASRAAFGNEWKADEIARQLIDAQRVHPFMIVSIDNSPNRVDEYTPVPGTLQGRTLGGAADKTLAFVCDELKPWIDREFPTQPNPESTCIVGSSLGGLTALHALQTRADVFGSAAAVSPSLFWGEQAALRSINAWTIPKPPNAPLRLWIDSGTREGEDAASHRRNVEQFEAMRNRLAQLSKESIQVHAATYPEAQHREADWAGRLPEILAFLLEGHEPTDTK